RFAPVRCACAEAVRCAGVPGLVVPAPATKHATLARRGTARVHFRGARVVIRSVPIRGPLHDVPESLVQAPGGGFGLADWCGVWKSVVPCGHPVGLAPLLRQRSVADVLGSLEGGAVVARPEPRLRPRAAGVLPLSLSRQIVALSLLAGQPGAERLGVVPR